MDWIEDDMNISSDDMLHELFNLFGTKVNGTYHLKINDNIFETFQDGEDWTDEYYLVKDVNKKTYKFNIQK